LLIFVPSSLLASLQQLRLQQWWQRRCWHRHCRLWPCHIWRWCWLRLYPGGQRQHGRHQLRPGQQEEAAADRHR
jgi:hypothetical protein